MNIATIRKHASAAIEAAQAAYDRKADIDEPTDADTDKMDALEAFREAVETALDDLNSVYEG